MRRCQIAKHQIEPQDSDWRTWLLLGGRGSGKTFAGAVWIDALARQEKRNFALIAPALHLSLIHI